MLPNLGYFRAINCPEVTKCDRPYCPFRHPEKGPSTQQQINEVNKAIDKLKNKINDFKPDYSHDNGDCDNNGDNNDGYVPYQPYQSSVDLYVPFSEVEGTSKEVNYSGIPPKTTKKFTLKGAKGATSKQVLKTKYEKVKPIKYQPSDTGNRTNDLEYDPMSNFNVKEILNQDQSEDSPQPEEEELPSSDLMIVDDDVISDDVTTDDVTTDDVTTDARFSSTEVSSQEEEKIDSKNEEKIEKKEKKSDLKIKAVKTAESPKKRKSDKKKSKNQERTKKSDNKKSKSKTSEKLSAETKSKKKLIDGDKNKSKKKVVKSKEEVVKKTKKVEEICDFDREAELKMLEQEMNEKSTYEECLQIFQNSFEPDNPKPKEKPKPELTRKRSEEEKTAPVVQKNKRIAHQSSSNLSQRAPKKARTFLTPAQAMMKRLEEVKREKAAAGLTTVSVGRVAHSTSAASNPAGRTSVQRRPFQDLASTSISKQTTQGTALKGFGRVAHIGAKGSEKVNGEVIQIPRILPDRYSKVPTNIRQKYLMRFIGECLRITNKDKKKAYKMAAAEEETCKNRSKTKNIYLSLAASALKRLMSAKKGEAPRGNSPAPSSVTSNNHKGGYTIIAKEKPKDLTAGAMYDAMRKFLLSEQELLENGFPRSGEFPGLCSFKDDIKVAKPSVNKTCGRCGKEFVLNRDGTFETEAECTFHWGRANMTKVGAGREKRYSCCQNQTWVQGCCVGPTHVHADNKLDNTGYVKTLVKSPKGESPGIYSFDCEMCYTVNGLELARVSIVDMDENIVYDTFVKPSGRILDYNTRWSGITEESLVGVTTSLLNVQTVFLSKFSSETIFVGHSLESDLVALRLIHSNIVDTSVVFPHRLGPPFKRALRNLMSEHLGIIIQSSADDGHDSFEDATACIKLMKWKINGQKPLF